MMDPKLILGEAPPLHPSWLAHEDSFNLLAAKTIITDPILNQKRYSDTCKAINAELLAGRDKHLTENIATWETNLEVVSDSAKTHSVPLRKYFPTSSSGASETFSSGPLTRHTVVYFHGGGLYVGDLDSEDLTCRRIVKVLVVRCILALTVRCRSSRPMTHSLMHSALLKRLPATSQRVN